MKTFAKILSLVLALCMMSGTMSALAEGFTPAASYDPGERNYDGGEITTVKAGTGAEGKDYTDEKVYTFNDFTAELTSSTNWDPLSWETADDSNITGWITTGYYTFLLNSDKSGYSVKPELAAEMPVDVTAEYAGQYGVSEGETGKAWRIALNQDLTWDDGTKITSADFVYSMQQLLNPKMMNRRADSY